MATKHGKSNKPRTLVRESASLEDCMNLLEDSVAKADEHYSVLTRHMGLMEDGLHVLEDSIAAAMATFREQLEQFRYDLDRRDDDKKALIEEIISLNNKIDDLKTRVAILEKAVARGALVDTGATHNFIAEAEAKRLKLEKDTSEIKAVNLVAQPVTRVAKVVTIAIGP
uniref:Uncharacterized protein n=1 Tax=Ananas comosus var. bracteatus TaxID=296719 RepID=A0A6V7Q938_ANACO|nr:unnamed protein product [Ananas comosus var. bracteatus]